MESDLRLEEMLYFIDNIDNKRNTEYINIAKKELAYRVGKFPIRKADDYVYCPSCNVKLALSYGAEHKVANSQKKNYCGGCGQRLEWKYIWTDF